MPRARTSTRRISWRAATPGIKSTGDGWLNRYLQARRTEADSSFRAVSLTQQMPRALQGVAPAVAMSQLSQFGVRGDRAGASFEEQYAAAADRVLNGTGRDTFDAIRTLKTADPSRYQPEHGADYPAQPVRPGVEADRAALEGRRRARGRLRGAGRMGYPRQPGRRAGSARDEARRLRAGASPRSSPTSAIAWTTPSSSRCPSSAARSARTATAAPITATATRCW